MTTICAPCVSDTWVRRSRAGQGNEGGERRGSGDGSGWVTAFNNVIESIPLPNWLTDRAGGQSELHSYYTFFFFSSSAFNANCTSSPNPRPWTSASQHTDLQMHEQAHLSTPAPAGQQSERRVTFSGFLLIQTGQKTLVCKTLEQEQEHIWCCFTYILIGLRFRLLY